MDPEKRNGVTEQPAPTHNQQRDFTSDGWVKPKTDGEQTAPHGGGGGVRRRQAVPGHTGTRHPQKPPGAGGLT